MKLNSKTVSKVLSLLNGEDGKISKREIARRVFGKDSKESTVRHIEKNYDYQKFTHSVMDLSNAGATFVTGPKIFIGDVECAASVVYSFGRFKAFIKPDQVIQEPYLLTFAGKWLDNPVVESYKLTDYPEFEEDFTSDKAMVHDLWRILDECDIFVAHNARFDVGWLNQRFAIHGLQPPSPYKVIDTLAAIRSVFSLPANSLEAACNYFGTKHRKLGNAGWSLWQRCMEGDPTAFEEMEEYNIGDIYSLEDLYLKARPWMKNHPNVAAFSNSEDIRCPRCNSTELELTNATYKTQVSDFPILRCKCCGGQARTRENVRSKEKKANTILPVG